MSQLCIQEERGPAAEASLQMPVPRRADFPKELRHFIHKGVFAGPGQAKKQSCVCLLQRRSKLESVSGVLVVDQRASAAKCELALGGQVGLRNFLCQRRLSQGLLPFLDSGLDLA